jgi:predicted DCC family thiol-disulfide oxidoreductase YuxK
VAQDDGPIVLFDGVCNLCNGTVQFLLKQDRRKKLRFASLQGAFGQALLSSQRENQPAPESFMLLDNGHIYTHSTGALRVLYHLGGVWKILSYLRVIPRFIRDGVYRFIAANRYRWFGKRDTCMVPGEDVRERFLYSLIISITVSTMSSILGLLK